MPPQWKPPDPGFLRDRLLLEVPVEQANEYGEPVQSWFPVVEVYARLIPVTGVELWQDQQTRADVTHEVTVRYRTEFATNPKMRGRIDTRVFNVVFVYDPQGGLKEWLVLQVKEEV